ncbi:MAG TPA: hypothetical protein VFA18_15070 [Gemmataceae bacterium]|nr:hypothetical protein [Gemmataceae bacterium]
MAQSPASWLLAVLLDEEVVLFDARTGTSLRSLKGPGGRVVRVTFSSDSQLLTSGGEDKSVRVRCLADARKQQFRAPNKVNAVAFSLDGRTLAIGAEKRPGDDEPDQELLGQTRPAALVWAGGPKGGRAGRPREQALPSLDGLRRGLRRQLLDFVLQRAHRSLLIGQGFSTPRASEEVAFCAAVLERY